MEILVLAKDTMTLESKYDELWSILDAAKEAGVTYTKYIYQGEPSFNNYDAFIWIDFDKTEYFGKPFITICSLEDGDEELVEKVQELASYMFGKKEWEHPPWWVTDDDIKEMAKAAREEMEVSIQEQMDAELNQEPLNPTKIDVVDLGYEVTEEEVARMTIKEFVVNIEGKDVKIGQQDLVVLGKVANLMDKFGYRVKKVVV